MADIQAFINGRIYITSGPKAQTADFAECMVISGSTILHVGSEHDQITQTAIDNGAEVTDLKNKIVVPGFIDGHTHFLYFGISLRKLDLSECKSLAELRQSIEKYAKAHPEAPRILCRGWHQPSTGREALATQLDDLDPRPIFVEALDVHSTWCNTAALNELGLDELDQEWGDQIQRDENGRPSGLLAEGAQTQIIWPYLNGIYTEEEKQDALDEAFEAYNSNGYTGAIDMAMDGNAWEALQLSRKRHGRLPIHVAAHWFIPHGGTSEDLNRRIDEAIAMHQKWHPSKGPDFCIVGIKLISDGVVDGCTAALTQPYPDHNDIVQPLWPKEAMDLAVSRAAKAGLQVAVHAIGDAAIAQAVSAIADANTSGGRHRIEHLELASEEDSKRLGHLGIIASVQPVHSDPALVKDYSGLVGPRLWKRAFPYKEFLETDACVAFGTDAPTARHLPLPNLYNATTRRSATAPSMTEQTNVQQAFTLSQAFHAATAGAAYSRFAESWTGSLKKGMRADFVVLESGWTAESLLEAKVEQTWSGGKKLYQL
ncbi:amidohydrolase 3 [Lophiostoma macrostomum CBS 122681]|uniref:Amidohydrolase 3 n=1 Tax=Lophiostoma macrostomum CBS 122681 TaxID=1314788 RepID=A0A6A6SU43_9PLEO|nr:amidohydrolase 3 [Lophiostoma macrostomum CBS 122681]